MLSANAGSSSLMICQISKHALVKTPDLRQVFSDDVEPHQDRVLDQAAGQKRFFRGGTIFLDGSDGVANHRNTRRVDLAHRGSATTVEVMQGENTG